MASIEQQAKGGSKADIRYLTPLEIDTKVKVKYCRFKKNGIKYIDYKDADFLMYLVNEQGKILPRRLTGTSLKALPVRFFEEIEFSTNHKILNRIMELYKESIIQYVSLKA